MSVLVFVIDLGRQPTCNDWRTHIEYMRALCGPLSVVFIGVSRIIVEGLFIRNTGAAEHGIVGTASLIKIIRAEKHTGQSTVGVVLVVVGIDFFDDDIGGSAGHDKFSDVVAFPGGDVCSDFYRVDFGAGFALLGDECGKVVGGAVGHEQMQD